MRLLGIVVLLMASGPLSAEVGSISVFLEKESGFSARSRIVIYVDPSVPQPLVGTLSKIEAVAKNRGLHVTGYTEAEYIVVVCAGSHTRPTGTSDYTLFGITAKAFRLLDNGTKRQTDNVWECSVIDSQNPFTVRSNRRSTPLVDTDALIESLVASIGAGADVETSDQVTSPPAQPPIASESKTESATEIIDQKLHKIDAYKQRISEKEQNKFMQLLLKKEPLLLLFGNTFPGLSAKVFFEDRQARIARFETSTDVETEGGAYRVMLFFGFRLDHDMTSILESNCLVFAASYIPHGSTNLNQAGTVTALREEDLEKFCKRPHDYLKRHVTRKTKANQ